MNVLGEKMRKPSFICLALVLTTLAIYLPVARNDFVNYDDPDYVTSNSHVQSGLTWENIVWAFRTGHASNWHPLTWLSHMLDVQVWGPHPGPQHLVSLGFHLANMLLLFLVLRQMTGAVWKSGFVAALFALHPLHVESVAWISERKDVVSTLFFLLTLWAYVQYVKKVQARTAETSVQLSLFNALAFYVLALVFFVLGLMSKPMLVTTPFLLLLLDFWPLQRFQLKSQSSNSRAHLVLEKLPFLVLSVGSSVVTFLVQRKGGAVSSALTLGARVANALVSYVRYLRKLFWPDDLSVLYPHPGDWPVWRVLLCAALLGAISTIVVMQARKRPYLLVGWLWFLGTLVPVIGLVQVGIQSMADRYMYVPMIGLLLMPAWGLNDMFPSWTGRSRAFVVGGTISLIGCALVTTRQIQYWRNSESLFRRAVAVTQNNYLAYNNLGFYLAGQGRTDEAMENYRKSLEINPAYADALNNMGYALAGQKKPAEAIPYYEAALRAQPDNPEVHNNLGNALSDLGRIAEAIEQYRIVLGHNPGHADAHSNLGIALAMQGKIDEAIGHFREAICYKPNHAGAHSNLGNALAIQHKLPEAVAEYQECLRLKPDDAQAHNNLGNALAEQGKLEEAIIHYNKALQFNPDNPEAHFNLAMTFAREGKRADVLSHLNEALRLKPDYLQAKQQLEIFKSPVGK